MIPSVSAEADRELTDAAAWAKASAENERDGTLEESGRNGRGRVGSPG